MKLKEGDGFIPQGNYGWITGYHGVCDQCGTPHEYEGPILVGMIEDSELTTRFIVVSCLLCPVCDQRIGFLTRYKSMDVTAEFSILVTDKEKDG
jgi:hypothetical protein